MKKLFTLVSFLICLTAISSVSAYQVNNQGVGQCIDPCVGQCESSCKEGKFYVGAFGGANWLNIHRIEGKRLRTKLGYTGALSLGYKFNNGFRVEGEASYRRNRLDARHLAKEFSLDSDNTKINGSFYSWSYMANFLYDFDQVSDYLPNVVPYVGFGVGYTQNHAHLKKHAEDSKEHHKFSGKGVAYQGIAGIGYRLTESTTLAVEYRYFAGKNRADDHGVGLAIRQSF
jgi:opacity protein-like surface antigen